jgi:hypothetical protein
LSARRNMAQLRSRPEHVLAETRNLSSGKILLRLQTKSFKLNGHLR